jgi:hypothetical protein
MWGQKNEIQQRGIKNENNFGNFINFFAHSFFAQSNA